MSFFSMNQPLAWCVLDMQRTIIVVRSHLKEVKQTFFVMTKLVPGNGQSANESVCARDGV